MDLEELLALARDADPAERIKFRDSIAAHGDVAVEAMIDWLGDPRLAAFAIRVLEKIGRQPIHRSIAIAALVGIDRTALPVHIAGDLDWTLTALGYSAPQLARRRSARPASTDRPSGMPGVRNRGYWVMRTSQWERPFIWAEAQQGRLRQGWGTTEDQNLETLAAAVRRGQTLSEAQLYARRSLRMLPSWDQGMRLGDIVVAPNLPEYGRLSIFRLTGSYEWSPVSPRQWGERFGHILPVELLAANINRRSVDVSDGLRSMLGVQTRLFNITGYGGDVERLIGGPVSSDRRGELWAEAEYDTLFRPFPPDGNAPSGADLDALAAELGRTPDAISWQWSDGAAYCTGKSASTTSEQLKTWLDDVWICR